VWSTDDTATATVSLPMYDLDEVRPATVALRDELAIGLTRAGWPATGVDFEDPTHVVLEDHWRSPDVALSQSCGLPVVEPLRGRVHVLGTFRWLGVTDANGGYASAILVSARSRVRGLSELTWARPAVNSFESLSGWASLGAALAGAGLDHLVLGRALVTGSHVASVAAVAEGWADVAAVDAVTLALLRRYRPAAVAGVRVIAVGPRTPATPLITCRDPKLAPARLRDVVRGALAEPALRSHLGALGITGFIDFDESAFAAVAALTRRAEMAIPRSAATATWSARAVSDAESGRS
jgi:ABC-type phosphate/phosphonate transport system substrate-binding protein